MGGEIPKDDWENIIWIDENIENRENKEYSKLLEESRLLKKKCTKVEEAIEELKKISFKEVKIIIAGILYQKFVESFKQNIKDMKVAPKIIVFTMNKENFLTYNREYYENADNKFYTFGGIKTRIEEIVDFLKNKTEPEKLEQKEEEQLTFEPIDTKEKLLLPLFFKSLIENKKEDSDKYNALLYKTFIEENERKNEYKDCNEVEKLLNILRSKKGIPAEILSKYYAKLYTANFNLYKDIGRELRQNKREKHLPFIKTLYEGIKLKSLKLYEDDIELYRGSVITNNELNDIRKYLNNPLPNLPGVIAFSKSFQSFSKEREKAERFLKKANPKDDESRVLYILQTDKNCGYNLSTHCDIHELSFYPTEEEVLFLPFSCFEIKNNIEEKELGEKKYFQITLLYLGKYMKEIEIDKKKKLFLDESILPESKFKKQLFEFGLITKKEKLTVSDLNEAQETYENIVNDNNFIIGEINITPNNINKEIQIINSFENVKKNLKT